MFLHIGIIHLAFNTLVFFQIGPFVERLVGNVGFVTAYFASGIVGSVTSLAWHPYTVSAGASGAIFGLYGVLLGFFLMSKRDSIPAELISSLSKGALLFLGYNVVYGVIHEGTDLADHAGGLAAGFLCGLVLSTPLTVEHKRRRLVRSAFAGARSRRADRGNGSRLASSGESSC
jgi:membrane associated rhomboid family serine protease